MSRRSCPDPHNSVSRKQCHSTRVVVLSISYPLLALFINELSPHLQSPPIKFICKLFTPSLLFILLRKCANSAQRAMATMGTKPILLLGLVVAALVMAAAQPEDKKNVKVIGAAKPAVTIYNPAGLVVDILNDDKNVRVTTQVVTVSLTEVEEDLQFSVAGGNVVEVITVQDGDVLVLISDPADPLHVQALKVLEGGDASFTHPQPGPPPPPANQPATFLP